MNKRLWFFIPLLIVVGMTLNFKTVLGQDNAALNGAAKKRSLRELDKPKLITSTLAVKVGDIYKLNVVKAPPLKKIAIFASTIDNGKEILFDLVIGQTNKNGSFKFQGIVPPSASGLIFKFQAVIDDFHLTNQVSIGVLNVPTPINITGDLEKWKPLTFSFEIPGLDATKNPHLDYRVTGCFEGPSGQKYVVPGYFDGSKTFKLRFSADEVGLWNLSLDVDEGSEIAVDLELDNGEPIEPHGAETAFLIGDISPEAKGFYKKGRLEYVKKPYLKFCEKDSEGKDQYFVKGGVNSPETWLAGLFPNTPNIGTGNLLFTAHEEDFKPGDPTWEQGDSTGIIGALNYLCDQGINAIYLMPHNVGGDGQNIRMYTGFTDYSGNPANQNKLFDVTKLKAWDKFFEHAQRKGIFVHFVLNEAETQNKLEHDNAQLGVERKLYYRELIARFAHHLGLQWNVSEEYDLNLNLGFNGVTNFANRLRALDPYNHPIGVHNAGENALNQFLNHPTIDVLSFQAGNENIAESKISLFRSQSNQVACLDEIPVGLDFTPTPVYIRKYVMTPAFMNGGHFEFFVTGKKSGTGLNIDQVLDDFKQYESLLKSIGFARKFIELADFIDLESRDDLLTTNNGKVLANPGKEYLVYLPFGGNLNLLIPNNTTATIVQYDLGSGESAPAFTQFVNDGSVTLNFPVNGANFGVALHITLD